MTCKITKNSNYLLAGSISQQIVDEIKQSLISSELQEDVLEVLFTSFVIQ